MAEDAIVLASVERHVRHRAVVNGDIQAPAIEDGFASPLPAFVRDDGQPSHQLAKIRAKSSVMRAKS